MFARTLSTLAVLALVAGCPGKDDPATLTVRGSVVSLAGGPIAGARVRIPGHPEQLTDAQGAFSVGEVEPPYDLVAVAGAAGEEMVSIYLALTAAAPVVAVEVDGVQRTANASGSLADFPAADGSATRATLCSPEVSGFTFPVLEDGSFATAFPFDWEGPVNTTVSLAAVRYAQDVDGLPTSYAGVWTGGTVSIADGASATGIVLDAHAATTATFSAQALSIPTGYSLALAAPAVSFGPHCGVALPFLSSPPESFTYAGPVFADTRFHVAIRAENADHDSVTAVLYYPAGETARAIIMPQGISISSPTGADTLTTATPFAWTADPQGVALLRLYSTPGTPAIRLVTATPSVTLARLSDAGVELPAGADYGWSIATLPFATTDAAATAEAIRAAGRLLAMQAPYAEAKSATTETRHILVASP